MSKIHFIPVNYGDSFIIECEKGGHRGVVLVDGGPKGCGKIVEKKVKEVGTPDLLVLSHYDDDHIYGLHQYMENCWKKKKLSAREFWANCAGNVKKKDEIEEQEQASALMPESLAQGVKLSRLLAAVAQSNNVVWREDLIEGVKKEFPFASIEVVSPTKEFRDKALEKMDVTAVKTDWEVPKQEESMELMPESEEEVVPFDVLAQDSPKAPNIKQSAELANASSIAFILRCDDLSILMLGDCYPHNVEAYLRSKGYSEDNPLAVDFVKVAHHGSRHNTSNELLDIILCNHYILSTNGQKFGHPDRESLAHILCHPRRDRNEKVHFYFNCDLKTIEKNAGTILYADEPETWNFEIHENANEIDPLEPALRHGQGSAQEYAQGPVVIDRATLKKLTAEASASPNLRKNLDLRNSPEDQSQRMLNAIQPGSELPIHRHLKSSETVVCLSGQLQEIFYDDNGTVTEIFDLVPNSKCMGLSIPKGQWHKAVAIKSGTVILETKDGPYAPLGEDEMMNP